MPDTERCGCPLAHSIHGENRGILERRREERAGRMRFVVLGIEDLAAVAEPVTDLPVHVQLVLDPQRARLQERAESAGCDVQIRLEYPLKLQQRLVVEADKGELVGLEAPLLQTVARRVDREGGVTLLARESFLLRRRDDLAVTQQTGRAIVVESGDAEDVGGTTVGQECDSPVRCRRLRSALHVARDGLGAAPLDSKPQVVP